MPTKSLVVILLLVAVAAAAWFVFRAGFAPDVPVAPPAAAPAVAPAPAERSAERAAGERPAVAAPVQRTVVPAPVAAAASDAAATYRVRGRLVDVQGAPRASVEVTASTWPVGDDLEILRSAAAGAGAPPAPRSTTNRAGEFVLDIPTGRAGSLELHDDELVFVADAPQFPSGNGDQDLGDVVAVRSGALQGVVQDENGRPVADVKVEAAFGVFAFGTRSEATTGADGTFAVGKLRPGKWQVRTVSSRFMPTTLEVLLAAEERRVDLVLVVRPGRAIAGQVVDERGVGVAGCRVGSQRVEVRGAMNIQRFSSDEATTSDAAGFFTLAGLREGTATIRAFGPGHTTAMATDVAVGTGDLVLRVQRLAAIEGVLVAADGSPIAGSLVTIEPAARAAPRFERPDEMPSVGRRSSATTGRDGTFRVESVTPGIVHVSARGAGHLPAERADLELLPGQTLRGVRLIADAGATARVTVVDADGKPVADARVRVTREPAEGELDGRMLTQAVEVDGDVPDFVLEGTDRLGAATTDRSGIALVSGLPAGPARFVAEHASFAAAPPATVSLPRVGSTEVRLQLQVPGFVEVHAVGVDGADAEGAPLRIAAAGPRGRRADEAAVTGGDGRVRVGPLAPGEYTAVLTRKSDPQRVGDAVFVFGDEHDALAASRQSFVVVAGETTQVELRRPLLTRLQGAVLGADGPMPDCAIQLARRDEDSFAIPGFGGRSARTGPDGTFEFADVEAGAYTLRFGKEQQLVKACHDVDVPPNVAELRQDLLLRTGRVSVRVHEAGSGTPIEGAEVELERAESAGPQRQERILFAVTTGGEDEESMLMTTGVQRTHTDAQGLAEVDDVPVGTYTLRVHHKGHTGGEKQQQLVVERQTTDCGRLELSAAGSIRGTLAEADGGAATLALVQQRRIGTDAWSEPEPAMGGSYRLDALPPGRYAVRAQRPGSGAVRTGPEVEVEVKAGAISTADLRLPGR